MKRNHVRCKNYLLTALLLVPCPLLANESTHEFTAAVSALTGQSDNAFKTNDEKIDERQDEYRLNIGGNYTDALVLFDAEYNASDYRFAEDSQESEQFLDGNSSLLIGKERNPAELLITHSRKTLLRSSDDIALTNNQEEREIISISPTVRANFGHTDYVFITGTETQVSYQQNALFDSERSSVILGWAHNISSIQALRLIAQQMDVDYDNFEPADYTHYRSELSYTAHLRYLTYNLKAGYNKTESPLGFEFDGPTYAIDMAYKNGLHEIQLTSSQQITDSAFGGANTPTIDEVPSSDGGRTDHIEQIERLNSELRWSSVFLCERCNIFVATYQRDESYLLSELSSKTRGATAGIVYRLTKSSTLSARSGKNYMTYTGLDLGSDYTLRHSVVEYTYKFINGLGVKLFAQQEKRTSDSLDQRYSENYIGGGLDYTF